MSLVAGENPRSHYPASNGCIIQCACTVNEAFAMYYENYGDSPFFAETPLNMYLGACLADSTEINVAEGKYVVILDNSMKPGEPLQLMIKSEHDLYEKNSFFERYSEEIIPMEEGFEWIHSTDGDNTVNPILQWGTDDFKNVFDTDNDHFIHIVDKSYTSIEVDSLNDAWLRATLFNVRKYIEKMYGRLYESKGKKDHPSWL